MQEQPQPEQKDECTPLVNDHHSGTNGTFDPKDDGLEAIKTQQEDDANTSNGIGGLLRKRSRDTNHLGHRRDSSIIEITLDALHDLGDAIVENVEHAAEQVHDTFVEVTEEVKEVLEEPIAVPVKPREEGDHSQKLGVLSLAILVFYKVSGGPFGSEPSVKAAGPFYAILGFILFPFIWAIPEAMITAELGSAYPEPSGSIAWVEEAFGPSAGLLCGYFHWISGATDNAIYPSLFLRYIASYLTDGDIDAAYEDQGGELARFAFVVAITTVLALINYTGLEVVGNLSTMICIVSLSPFLILVVCAIPKLDTARWFKLPEEGVTVEDTEGIGFLPPPVYLGVAWRPFLNSLFWNLNSFDAAASFAGEIQDPQRVFPRAMFLSIILTVGSYVIPLMAAIGAADTDQADWEAGYFTVLANEIGGPWLGVWLVFAAAISNIGLFEAEMSGDAYQLMGMADRGLIPKVFTKRSRFGTPTNGILLGTFVIFAVSVADFDQLVEMLNCAYSFSMIMEFFAFVKMRITDDDVDRPFRIPLNTFGCILFIIPPVGFLVYVLLIASKLTYIYLLGLTLFGMLFHLLQKLAKHYRWWEYVEAPKRKRNLKAGITVASATENSA